MWTGIHLRLLLLEWLQLRHFNPCFCEVAYIMAVSISFVSEFTSRQAWCVETGVTFCSVLDELSFVIFKACDASVCQSAYCQTTRYIGSHGDAQQYCMKASKIKTPHGYNGTSSLGQLS